MHIPFEYLLKALRKTYTMLYPAAPINTCYIETSPKRSSQMIYNLLSDDRPCMIARFGGFELSVTANYIGVKSKRKDIISYIRGKTPDLWWNTKTWQYLNNNAGFFPLTLTEIERFCELMLKSAAQVDILGSWQDNEQFINFAPDMKRVKLMLLEPFWNASPWTKALEGKKVLVVHPFARSIEKQYNEQRNLLFDNPDIIPLFELSTIEAVQSIGGQAPGFNSWFEALAHMQKQIDHINFDICLLGCGAYGFPLAAYVKSKGKKAVHLGGALQLLFGIRGKRWENPDYGVKAWNIPYGSYLSLMNEHWIRPKKNDIPLNANQVEDACYW